MVETEISQELWGHGVVEGKKQHVNKSCYLFRLVLKDSVGFHLLTVFPFSERVILNKWWKFTL